MVRIRIFLVIAVVWGFFHAGGPVQAEPGFYRASDSKIPKPVQKAAESVFEVFIVERSAKVMTSVSYGFYQKALESNEFSEGETQRLDALLIKRCAVRKQNDCPLYQVLGFATAFVAGDKQTLWTARHVLETALIRKIGEKAFKELTVAGQIEAIRKTPVNIVIVDTHQKNILVDTIADGETEPVQVAAVGRPDLLKNPTAGRLFTDFAKLHLFKPLAATPLKFAEFYKDEGPAYIPGYPRKVNRKSHPSDGHGLYVSAGKRISTFDAFKCFSDGMFSGNPYDVARYDYFLHVSDIDGVPGQSGSPLLNDKGEVIGIFFAIFFGHYKDQKQKGAYDYESFCGTYSLRSDRLYEDAAILNAAPPFAMR